MIGQTLSHYRIVDKLGKGGMGVVYKARDTHSGRFVAIKVLPAEKASDRRSRKRLLREAQAASAVNHPHVVTIYDIASENDMDFIVMEFIEGKSLRRLIPRSGMGLKQALDYAIDIGDALAAAHNVGIVHRDLKPRNVMVNKTGCVKVLDFGLAKLTHTDSESQHTLTLPGTLIGTVAYMSPEQARGDPVDQRGDVYSFGVLLYEMLAGTAPFRGPNALAVLSAIQSQEPRPIGEIRPDTPVALRLVIEAALAKKPEDRYGSMSEVVTALRAISAEVLSGKAADDPTITLVVGPESRAPANTKRNSIAVLPFHCHSANQEDSCLAAGIAAEIINALSRIPGIRAAPHPASFQFILTGSLRRAGNRIRVVAELSDFVV